MRTPSTVVRGVFVCLIILGVLFISFINVSGSVPGGRDYPDGVSNVEAINLGETPTTEPTLPPPSLKIHLPLILNLGIIELEGAWINNSTGDKQYGFLPGDTRQYVVQLANASGFDTAVKLTWVQDGLCEQKGVMDEDFILKPGTWQIIKEDIAPDCLGVSSHTIQLSYGGRTKSLAFNSAVIQDSSVILGGGQGFDNCTLPSVSQMQTWWDHSPYTTVNIYLGGISAACPMNRDAAWLYKVSQQGWSYILTWVGPQAPCTGFNHRMSRNPATAYQQGKDNAEAAVSTAKQRGFLGDLVIYYDLESYYSSGKDDPECREAVNNFIQGWTERIHELGHTAGAYGSACGSFMSEWAANADPPDNVWFAHWYTNNYDPDADVGDVPCIGNGIWANHQRLKQYTGGHKETWGGLQMSIDSNVLDGQISAIIGLPFAQASSQQAQSGDSSPVAASKIEPAIRTLQMLSPGAGWVLRGEQLYWTEDGGASWRDISPAPGGGEEILDVTFLDTQQGWLVSKQISAGQGGSLSFLRTEDGGATWQEVSVPIAKPEEAAQIASAVLDFIDSQTGWIALQLHSSSNFSIGRLLATEDGGRTWQERTAPLGEPVNFQDANRGWIAGGPLDQVYYTEDGGESWNLSGTISENPALGPADPLLPSLTTDENLLAGELPPDVVTLELFDDQIGWAIVQEGSCTGYKPRAGESVSPNPSPLQCESATQLLMTTDGGISWQELSPP